MLIRATLFRVRCFREHYIETRRIINKLTAILYKALHEADIEIPFPQRFVHVQNMAPPVDNTLEPIDQD